MVKKQPRKGSSLCGYSTVIPILLIVTLTPIIFNFNIGGIWSNDSNDGSNIQLKRMIVGKDVRDIDDTQADVGTFLSETDAMLGARLDKLAEQQLNIDKLLKDIEDTHAERSLRISQPAVSSFKSKIVDTVQPVAKALTKVREVEIFKEPPPVKLLNGALTCSANATIRVDRAAADASGLYWYDRSAKRCSLTEMSHKMEPGCAGVGNERKKAKQRQILVVGVQRSGTHFTWEMFNRLGVHVHHEGLGPDGSVSWLFAYKANNYAINNPEPLSTHKFCFVFHQVRHPMRVVSSIVKASRKAWDPYWDYIARVEPKVCGSPANCKTQPLLLRSARQWLVWNEHIETYADVRFRVEDTSPRAVCRLANFPARICESDGRFHTTSSKVIQPIVEPQAPSDGHTGVDHLVASWDAISKLDEDLAKEMQTMTRRYGYSLDAADHPQSLSTETFRAGGLEKKKRRLL